VLVDGELADVTECSQNGAECALDDADVVVWEVPQGDGRTMTTDDAVRVAAAGAELAGRSVAATGSIVRATPREWKGSLPKAICHLRMWQALSDTERALLGGEQTAKAIANACNRGAKARWKKHANHHYSNRDLPKVGELKITHDILDAVSLGLWYLGRLNLAAVTKG
jgi:hypothetical protein